MTSSRIYISFDQVVGEGLARAPRTGLVTEQSSRAKKLHALVEFATAILREEDERDEKIAAYRELAADTDRAAAIRDANRAAVARGVL